MITLDNLEQATADEVFRQVGEHLLNQNKRSWDDEGNCLYFSENGRMCAAGCLIGEKHKETISGLRKECGDPAWNYLVELKVAPDKHRLLISELQVIHDYDSVKQNIEKHSFS